MSSIFPKDDVVKGLLRRGFYSTVFQPLVDVKTITPMGFEALLRGPEGTPFESPGDLFNRGGLLSDQVLMQLDMACVGSALRNSRPLPKDTNLFVNINCKSLLELACDVGGILDLLAELEIRSDRVVFELSENMGMENTMEVARCAEAFRKHGFRFALDDIGVRSPYLYHILWLEPEFVKLDRTFITDLHTFERKKDLVHGVTMMVKKMGASLVAEGVESREEFEVLREMDVSYVQGYYFAKPVSSEDCKHLSYDIMAEVIRSGCEDH
jgi:EAL domain-containing protein (putative c-di-GMP-specific phosphodiesterase class I)